MGFEAVVRIMAGTGTPVITGHLGSSSKEAVLVALSWANINLHNIVCWIDEPETKDYVLAPDRDVAIHFANVAGLSKAGFSLGAAAATAIMGRFLEELYEMKLKKGVAITGEINLRGELLPVGDIFLKLRAAWRLRCTTVIVPEGNKAEIDAALSSCTDGSLKQWISRALVIAKDMVDVLQSVIEGKH